MFKKLKNLFRQEKPVDKLGFISYNLLESGEIQVEINLKKLDDESLQKFAGLFAKVTTLALSSYTINLTKELFMETGEDYYVKMILYATEECNHIIENYPKTEEEYIKPSEMFNE